MSGSRHTFLLNSEMDLLHDFGEMVCRLFDDDQTVGAYLVGSATSTKDYRDVDVRIVLHDAEAEKVRAAVQPRRFHLMLSLWGQQVTGLPIDAQVQSLTESGEEAARAGAAPHPLGKWGR